MTARASTHFGSDGHVAMTPEHTGRKNARHVAHFVARSGNLVHLVYLVSLVYLISLNKRNKAKPRTRYTHLVSPASGLSFFSRPATGKD
jgi:hypothetical protein